MKKREKQLLSLILAGTLAGTLVGCMPTAQKETTAAPAQTTAAPAAEAPKTEEPAKAEGLEVNTTDPITIRFNWWGGDSRHEKTLKAIEAFEAKYPNITVEAEYEAFSGHEEKVALGLKAGSAADVIQLNMDWVFAYSPEGTTLSLIHI